MIDKILEWFPEDELLKIDGFDDAIIGIEDLDMRLIYSCSKIIDYWFSDTDKDKMLVQKMDEEDGQSFSNTLGG